MDINNRLGKLHCRLGAKESDVAVSEEGLGICFPGEYREFLKLTNGGEGFIGKCYVIFWSTQELIDLNRAFQVQQFAPGLVVFGSDGGGEAFGFDKRNSSLQIVRIPFANLEWLNAEPVAPKFDVFLMYLQGKD